VSGIAFNCRSQNLVETRFKKMLSCVTGGASDALTLAFSSIMNTYSQHQTVLHHTRREAREE